MIPVEAISRNHWDAQLALEYGKADGGTVLTQRQHRGPLRVQKALYPEGSHTCHTIIVHPPGGIAGGDRLALNFSLGEGARALLTTPGAAKWYRSAGSDAQQSIHCELRSGAVLEWLPQETIVFDAARAGISTAVRLSGDALYVGWEILCLGRRASGERFERGHVRLATEIWRDDKRLWNEYALLHGNDALLTAAAGCATYSVCATLLVAGRDIDKTLLGKMREVEAPDTLCGISAVPGVLVARCLAHFASQARSYFTALWTLLRPALSSRAAVAPRIWST